MRFCLQFRPILIRFKSAESKSIQPGLHCLPSVFGMENISDCLSSRRSPRLQLSRSKLDFGLQKVTSIRMRIRLSDESSKRIQPLQRDFFAVVNAEIDQRLSNR